MTEVVVDQTSPILHGPSDKEKKYDRQLRLWAANGQQALEDAHILLINSGSGTVGVETLKNLVLPGIGQFTIMDGATVNEVDLGVNFFLDEQSLGKPRAQCCVDLLQELNPDVRGHWRVLSKEDPVSKLFEGDIKYTLIIYTSPVDQATVEAVREYSQIHQVPILTINSLGFYSYFHIDLPGNFPIVDTHPDSTALTDLRLLKPWTELSEFAKSMTENIGKLSAHEHGHIPYVVLLLFYLELWKEEHDGNLPETYKDKVTFRKMVADHARTDNPEGGEENYDEAVAAVLKTISWPSISSSVRDVFDFVPVQAESDSSFWIITDAVKQFYVTHEELPLPGSVPDMKAQSEVYVKLQNIYKKKAREDVSEVAKTVRAHPRGAEIDLQEIETYCKNAAFIKLIRSSTTNPTNIKELAYSELNAEFELTPSLLPIYLAMKASEGNSGSVKTQEEILAEISMTVDDAATDERIVQATQEVVRAKGGELHNISALTGGLVSQEVIKIITKQYIPVDNTVVFDGIHSRSQIFKFVERHFGFSKVTVCQTAGQKPEMKYLPWLQQV